MPTLQEQRETRANAWAQAQEFKARSKAGEAMSAEDTAAWTRALDVVDTLGAEVQNEERTATLEKRYAEIDAETEDNTLRTAVDTRGVESVDAVRAYRGAYDAWLRGGLANASAEQQGLLAENFRAMQTDTGAAGGYTVPDGFWAKVTETMKYFGGVRQVAEIIPTSTGAPLPWPTNDDTGNTGEILEEGNPVTEQNTDLGQRNLGAYTASSKMIKVSNLLLVDTAIQLEAFLGRKLGVRIGRIENTRLTTGNGASQSQGIITGATTGKTSAASTTIAYTDLIGLIHSVDAAYRAGGNCGWMFHDLILSTVRLIKDDSGGAGVGRPLWEPSLQAGVPDTLLGYKYTINNDMVSAPVTTAKTVAFGDFNAGYVVRTVNGGTMSRLAERYAEYLQTAFFGYERFDGLVQDSAAYKLLAQV